MIPTPSMISALPTVVVSTVLAGASLTLQGDPGAPDPAEVSERVEEIMSRPEYDYGPSWFDRFAEWIGKQLERLFGGVDVEQPAQGGQFLGGIGHFVAWFLIIAAALAVLAVVIYVIVKRTARGEVDDTPATETEIEHRRAAAQWRSDAERLEAEGEWKLALRARYRELVRTLTDRRQLPDVAGRTTGELRVDLDRTTPSASADFDTACLLFELAWYADVPTGPDESARFREAASGVLGARVLDTDGKGRDRSDEGGSTLVVTR